MSRHAPSVQVGARPADSAWASAGYLPMAPGAKFVWSRRRHERSSMFMALLGLWCGADRLIGDRKLAPDAWPGATPAGPDHLPRDRCPDACRLWSPIEPEED